MISTFAYAVCLLLYILLGVSGSVAAIKSHLIAVELSKYAEVRVIPTKSSKHFLNPLTEDIKSFTDEEEWSSWKKLKDPVLHIDVQQSSYDYSNYLVTKMGRPISHSAFIREHTCKDG